VVGNGGFCFSDPGKAQDVVKKVIRELQDYLGAAELAGLPSFGAFISLCCNKR